MKPILLGFAPRELALALVVSIARGLTKRWMEISDAVSMRRIPMMSGGKCQRDVVIFI